MEVHDSLLMEQNHSGIEKVQRNTQDMSYLNKMRPGKKQLLRDFLGAPLWVIQPLHFIEHVSRSIMFVWNIQHMVICPLVFCWPDLKVESWFFEIHEDYKLHGKIQEHPCKSMTFLKLSIGG